MRIWFFAGLFAAGILGACGDSNDDNGGNTGGNADTGNGGPQETIVGQGCEGVTPNVTISVGDAGFSLREVRVATGAVIRWENTGTSDHSVISGEPNHSDAGALFHSGTLKPGDSFCFAFNQASEVDFFCGIHPAEQGEVQVGATGGDNGDDRGRGRDRGNDDNGGGDDSNRGGGNDDPDNPSRG